MNDDNLVKNEIVSLLGPKSYVNNKLNSKFLRSKIFNSQNKLKK